jgi:hypothetical protein
MIQGGQLSSGIGGQLDRNTHSLYISVVMPHPKRADKGGETRKQQASGELRPSNAVLSPDCAGNGWNHEKGENL